MIPAAAQTDRGDRSDRLASGRRPNPEIEQSTLRVIIVAVIFVYLAFTASGEVAGFDNLTLRLCAGYLLAAIILALVIRHRPEPQAARRILGMVLDNSGTTLCLWLAGEAGSVAFGAYLWVAFGNGFRYGRRYLFASQAMSLIGFAAVLAMTEHWQAHREIGIGILIALMVLPAYVATLITRLQDALQRAEVASEAKTRFVSNVSHELRTPLNGIIGMNEILVTKTLTPDQRDIVLTLGSAAKAMAKLVDDILDLSKLEERELVIAREPIDLHRVVGAVSKLMRCQAEDKGLRLHLNIASDVPFAVVGDESHLRQVLLNLVGNAIKFTASGDVRVNLTMIGDDGPHVAVRFDVVDSGVGIDPAHHQRIFERFAQADESTARRFGGTGLGVTIAKQLVEAMGGEMGLISKPGNGSTFWFRLEFERVVTTPGRAEFDGAGVLLLADADADTPTDIAEQLAHSGAYVGFSTTAEEVIAAVTARPEILQWAVVVCGGSETADRLDLPRRLGTTPTTTRLACIGRWGASTHDTLGALAAGYAYAFNRQTKAESIVNAIHACFAESETSPAPVCQLDAPRPDVSVLLVDDNETNRKVATLLLENAGYRVTCASDGDTALDLLTERDFAIVLLDLHMPGMSGLEVLKTYRFMSRPEHRAKVVMLSADTTPQLMQETADAGASAYLMKPFDREKLLRTLLALQPDRIAADPSPAAGGGATIKVLDEELLDSLSQLSATGTFMPKLISGFLKDADASLLRLHHAVRAPHAAIAFADLTHALKGSAGNIGAVDLYRQCEKAAALSDGELAARGATVVAALEASLERTRQALSRYLGERHLG